MKRFRMDVLQMATAALLVMFFGGIASACHNPTRGSAKHNPVATVTHAAVAVPLKATKAAAEIAVAPAKIAASAVFGTGCANGSCSSGRTGIFRRR